MICSSITAQQDSMSTDPLPYNQIPDSPDTYSAENVIARMIDGLGFRYYWATKDLRQEDLDYKPSEDSRTSAETLDHLYGLSETIVNAPQNLPNIRPADWSGMSFEEKRRKTLENLQQASTLLKQDKEGAMQEYTVIFQRGDNQSKFPYWNMLNGPISDAIYHVGQIVAFRRASGNPIQSGVNVFLGKTRE